MSEDENERKPIKLKLSGQGNQPDGDKQSAAPTPQDHEGREQANGQSSKPARLELRRKSKKKENTPTAAEPPEDVQPEPEAAPERDTTPEGETAEESEAKTPKKPRLKPRPDPSEAEETVPEAESVPDENTPALGDSDRSDETGESNPPGESDHSTAEPKPEKPKLKTRPPTEEHVAPRAPDATEESSHVSQSTPSPVLGEEEEDDSSTRTPPPLPVENETQVEDSPENESSDLTEKVRTVAEGPGSSPSSPWLSILIIFVLLTVLAGSGFGLWFVLRDTGETSTQAATGDESQAKTSETPRVESHGKADTNSITKAKSTIESVPTEALDEVMPGSPSPLDQASPPPAPEKVASPTKPEPADKTRETDTTAATRKIPGAGNVDQELVQTVSAYLSKIHIGGVRTGERPMVIIDGKNHTPGDVVETETGLRFSGIRNGKLAFTDKNSVVYLKSF